MIDTLAKIFGSAARVKLLRLFLFNSRNQFTGAEAAARAQVTDTVARAELKSFTEIGLVKRAARGRVARYMLNPDFSHLAALRALLLNAPVRGDDIALRLRTTGTLKLVVISGAFVGNFDERLDLLVVGDRVKEAKLRTRIRTLESELGKELRFALLTTPDFLYRLDMNDKLVRDVMDYPHRIVLDRLQIGLK